MKPITPTTFPSYYKLSLLPILPLIIFGLCEYVFTHAVSDDVLATLAVIGLVTGIPAVFICLNQLTYMRSRPAYRNLLIWNNRLIAGTGSLYILAAIIGEIVGSIKYGIDIGNYVLTLVETAIYGFCIVLIVMIVLACANTLVFSSHNPNRALRLVGKLGYGLLWIGVVAVSYTSYSFAYTSYNQSSD